MIAVNKQKEKDTGSSIQATNVAEDGALDGSHRTMTTECRFCTCKGEAYLLIEQKSGSYLTVMENRDGKPVLTPFEVYDENRPIRLCTVSARYMVQVDGRR